MNELMKNIWIATNRLKKSINSIKKNIDSDEQNQKMFGYKSYLLLWI